MAEITVNLGSRAYPIRIEAGVLKDLGRLVRAVAPHERALLAVDERIASTHGARGGRSLRDAGYQVAEHRLIADESRKTLASAAELYAAMAHARLDRQSPVIAMGGGIVGDVAGFAASTYMRGLPVIQVPTTLLAMVDASIGGKTGVNFVINRREDRDESRGGDDERSLLKNMIGSFWQPVAVLADPETLRTLTPRDFRCGLAECVKHSLIADAGLLTFIDEHASAILALEMDVLCELIERSAAIKARIVEQDELETIAPADGRVSRALLNLGHTFAHAMESIESLDLRHGEAVSIGLAAAMRCAVMTGRMKNDDEQSVRDLLARLGLPIRLSKPVEVERLLAAMRYDKKAAHGTLRLILPTRIGHAEIAGDIAPEMIAAAWKDVAQRRMQKPSIDDDASRPVDRLTADEQRG